MSNYLRDLPKNNSAIFIKFYPGIQVYTGSDKAALILGRMEFWFSKYHSGFYKFLEPCNHKLYREGDSWSEEVGFSRKVFNRAFDLIGVRYKSKSSFQTAKEPFQGKLYASYQDRKTNRTYFVRNHAFASEFFEKVFHSPKSSSKTSVSLDQLSASTTNPASEDEGAPHVSKCRSRDVHFGRSYTNSLIHKKTTSLNNVTLEIIPKDSSDFCEKTEGMILFWKQEVGELGVKTISQSLLKRLYHTLETFFGSSLAAWQVFCRKIASSKFLMGEAKNRFFKKAWITWAIKSETIDLIQAGHFNCGDREIPKTQEETMLEAQLKEVRGEKEKFLMAKSRIEDLISGERKKSIQAAFAELGSKDKERFREDYAHTLRDQESSLAEAFKDKGWNMPFAEILFEMFCFEKLEKELFPEDLPTEITSVLKSQGISEKLESMSMQEQQLLAALRTVNSFNGFEIHQGE